MIQIAVISNNKLINLSSRDTTIINNNIYKKENNKWGLVGICTRIIDNMDDLVAFHNESIKKGDKK